MATKDIINNFKLVVDQREQHENSLDKNMIAKLDEQKIEYEKKMIPVGDYLLVNKISGDTFCVERKIISDFVSSVLDGRLKGEIVKMSEIYSKSFLIVVGKWEIKPSTSFISGSFHISMSIDLASFEVFSMSKQK